MRVLFTTQPGHGHLQPMAPYAHALVDAGDEVRVATAPSFCRAVESLGLQSVPIGVDFTWERPTGRFPRLADASRDGTIGDALREIVWDHWIPSAIEDLLPLVDAWCPDLVVHEAAEHAGGLVGRRAGIPTAVSAWGAVLTDPAWELATIPGSVARREYDRRQEAMGLEPDGAAAWETELTLSSLPPSWIPADLRPRPPLHHFRMPPLDGAAGDDAWDGPPEGERPLLYATLGTVFGWDHRLRTILLEALAAVDADVVMTVGRGADTSRITAPGNVRLEAYVPQSLVLPRAAAVVSHGGLGTMIGAIAAGVPMVLLDLGADHALNGGRAAELGIAETHKREGLEPEAVAAAIRRLLEDPGPRARAAALAAEYAQLPLPAHVVPVLHGHARAGR